MIECTFHNKGSDSLIETRKVLAVPRVGESLYFEDAAEYKVIAVIHELNRTNCEHKITVLYQKK